MSENSDFVEIERFHRGEVVVIITERKSTGHRSFKIGKVFKKRGQEMHSAFLSPHHLDDAALLLKDVERFLNTEVSHEAP